MKVEVAVLGSLDPNSPYGLCGRKATLNSEVCKLHSSTRKGRLKKTHKNAQINRSK